MLKKTCTKCKEDLAISEFGKRKKSKDGLQHRCKACYKIYREANKEQKSKYDKQWQKNNPEKVSKRNKKWNQNNPEKIAENRKQYQQNNPDKVNNINAKRRASKLQRTIAWANLDLILEFYTEAKKLTKETGIPHHVDHIVPLQGNNVSGLHVENNLQVITASENYSKGNRYDM